MNLTKIILCIASAIAFSGCIDEVILSETTMTSGNGFSTCTEYSGLNREYCTELRAYDAQIDNGDLTRLDPSSYTPKVNSSHSLAGTWLFFPKVGEYAGVLRQSCELNEQVESPNNFALTCSEAPHQILVLNTETNTFDIDRTVTIRTGDPRGDVTTTITTRGVISNDNRIEVIEEAVYENSITGTSVIQTQLYTLLRMGEKGIPLGQITVEKYDFDGNLQLMEQYDVAAILEKGNFIALSDMAGEPLAAFNSSLIVENTDNLKSSLSFNTRLYGSTYKTNMFPGVDPYLFDGLGTQLMPGEEAIDSSGDAVPAFELRLRQFDYVSNDANSLNINWLINRRHATRFERGDTIGNISLTF